MEKYTEDGNIKKADDKKQISAKTANLSAIVFAALNVVLSCIQEMVRNGYISSAAWIVILLAAAVAVVGLGSSYFMQRKNLEGRATTIAVSASAAQIILLMVVVLSAILFDGVNASSNLKDTTGVTFSESTQPSADTRPTEAESLKPTATTIPTVHPNIEIQFSSFADAVVKFNAVTVPEDIAVDWQSRDETIAAVDQEGRVTALSEGSVVILASITYDGEVYADKVTVTVTGELQVTETGTIRYFKSLPTGIDTEHSDFQNVLKNESIYLSQTAALKAVGLSEDTGSCSGEKLVGYVYFHWCRGQSLREIESHNRTSGATKGWHYSSLLQKDVWCDSFSCFFSDAYLSESEMNFAADGSGCMWFENYAVCNDSYWYWPIPVYECKYEVSQNRLSIDWEE